MPAADGAPSHTERAAALATRLLERHGIVTRDGAAAEQLTGGFSAIYPVLARMEESGRVRRGYFVAGLGGAQFALPGAVDRLRASSDPDGDAHTVVLAATDPANVYGAALAWPRRDGRRGPGPRRAAGAFVVLRGGRLVAFLERGARSLSTFTDRPSDLEALAGALSELVGRGRLEQLRLGRIDGSQAGGQPLVAHLRSVGFVDHPRGLVLR